MTLRTLKSSDLFIVVGILNKIGFKEMKKIFTPENLSLLKDRVQGEDKDLDASSVLGFNIIMDVAQIVLDNLPKIEGDLYRFLGSLTDTTADEIRDLPLPDFADLLVQVIKKPEFPDFFKAVSRLFN